MRRQTLLVLDGSRTWDLVGARGLKPKFGPEAIAIPTPVPCATIRGGHTPVARSRTQ